jgi:hypothetical protein
MSDMDSDTDSDRTVELPDSDDLDSDMETDTEQPAPRQLSKPERFFYEIYTFIDNQADDGEKDDKVARFLLRYVEHEGVFTTVRYTRDRIVLAQELYSSRYSLLKSAATAFFVSLAWYAKKHTAHDVEVHVDLHINVYNAYRETVAPRLEDGTIDIRHDVSMKRRFYLLIPQRSLENIDMSAADQRTLNRILNNKDPLRAELDAVGELAAWNPAAPALFPPMNASNLDYETDYGTNGKLHDWT